MMQSILAVPAALLSVGASTEKLPEHLVLEPYPDAQVWKEVTHDTVGAKFLIERVPSDQSADHYKDILVAMALPEKRGADPSVALRGIIQLAGGKCDAVRANGPKAQIEGGFNVAYGQVYCGRQRGTSFGLKIFYKIIQGNDAQYVVLRERHVAPSTVGGIQSFSKDQMNAVIEGMKSDALANTYLIKSVYLCGSSSADDRCKAQTPS